MFHVCWHWGDDGGYATRTLGSHGAALGIFHGINKAATRLVVNEEGEILAEWASCDEWKTRVLHFAEAMVVARHFFSADEMDTTVQPQYQRTIVTIWRRLHIVRSRVSGREWLLKTFRGDLTRDTAEFGCSTSSALGRDPNPGPRNFAPRGVLPGGVETMEFRPACLPGPGGRVCYSHPTSRPFGALWVCAVMVPGAASVAQLHAADAAAGASLMGVRTLLARGIGALHGATDFATTPDRSAAFSSGPRWVERWIHRANAFLSRQPLRDAAPAAAEIAEWINTNRGARMDALETRVVGSGDLQMKNMLAGGLGLPDDHVTVINTDVLAPTSPLQDVVWLLLLDDDASGMPPRLCAGEIAQQLAWALRVYKVYSGVTFTDEEVELYPNCVQIKLLYVAWVFSWSPKRPASEATVRSAIAAAVRLHTDKLLRDGVRQAMRAVVAGDRLYPSPCAMGESSALVAGTDEDSPYIYPQLLPALLRWLRRPTRSRGRAVLVHMNGSFAPPHGGHVESLARAVAAASRWGTVVGALVSPCHDAFLRNKLHDGAREWPASVRVGLLDVLLHSRWARRELAKAVPGGQVAVWVDTFEARFTTDFTSLYRLDSRLAALRRTVDAAMTEAGLKGSAPPECVLACAMGDDTAGQAGWFTHHCDAIRAVIVPRSAAPPQPAVQSLVRENKVVVAPRQTMTTSSTAVRQVFERRASPVSASLAAEMREAVGSPSLAARLCTW